ncbi:MAG TPA: SpoIIE family protein phosphatase [Terracidiphilus sp.]|nr:SpoIIE family protein phosphatase [Terracidiphilus sp.]
MTAPEENFIEIDYCQRAKHGQLISGDVFLIEKVKEEGRIVSVLSDGLGSGVKASVLATMTATMALKFAASPIDIRRSAEIIMDTLPICSVRKISYSTFTVVDMARSGTTRIIEHGNPSFLLIRPGGEACIDKTEVRPERWRDRVISYTSFEVKREDRIVFFSDGISQAGMGEFRTPLGWGLPGIETYIREQIERRPHISARDLSRALVARAEEVDGLTAKDDITCGVVYVRSPRQLLVMTGAPFNRLHDQDLARMAEKTPGRKVICGGTTANIISRQLDRPIEIDLRQARDSRVPPTARMQGFDLVTEGILTLGEVLRLLEEGFAPEELKPNAAVRLTRMLLDSDVVRFAVGTRINEAHQDPNIPVDLDLRRNIVKRIGRILEDKHMKRVHVQYI